MDGRESPAGGLHYLDEGKGEVVVLLHGLGSRASDWGRQIDALAGKYRVVAPDLRGHGDSPVPPRPWRIADFADDVLRLLDRLGVNRAHVIGFSLGGMVALEIASRAPTRLSTLCIINAAPLSGPRPFALRFAYWTRRFVIQLLGLGALGRMIGRKLFPRPEQRELAKRFAAQLERMPKSQYLASLDALYRWDLELDYGAFKVPTLVLAADNDYTPVQLKRDFAMKLPHGRLEVIADSRHASPLDQAERVNASLLAFLASPRNHKTTPAEET